MDNAQKYTCITVVNGERRYLYVLILYESRPENVADEPV